MKNLTKKPSIILLVLSVITLGVIMCFNISVFLENAVWLNIIIYSIIAILILCLIWSYFLQNELVFKLSIVSNIIFVFIYFLYFFLTKYGIIEQINSFKDIKNLILNYRGWGLFSYTIINFLQVVLIPIPSTLTILAGTAIFGPILAFIFASIGILLGSILAFLIGRYCSKPVLYWIFTKEKVDKYEKILSKRTKLILFLTLFLPFFPDDLICMLAGVTNIKIKDFLWISFLARSIGIATISFFGSGTIIPFNTWWGIVLWCLIIIFASIAITLAFKKRKKIASLFVKNKTHDK